MFSKAFVINLKRRPDRLALFYMNLRDAEIPEPTVIEATDGSLVAVPSDWVHGGGAFGCKESHCRILKQALDEKLDSILVLEDDAIPAFSFNERLSRFLAKVPRDWDCLMLGGQHSSPPVAIEDGIDKCTNCQRTHAYAIRGEMIGKLYSIWSTMKSGHIDWLADTWQPNEMIYAPNPFLFGQAACTSDINGRLEGTRFWSNTTTERRKHITIASLQRQKKTR